MLTGDLELDDWQRDILNYDGNILLCTGRQVGKTSILGIKSAEFMINHPKSTIIVVSLTEDQAKLIISMILSYLEKHHKSLIAKGKFKPTQNRIVLSNKSMVLARPVGNTGDALRGFTGDVLIIDEGSRMPELAFSAGMPTLMTTAGKVWMASTPFGKKGYFYKAFLNADNRYKVFHISSEDVIKNRKLSKVWTDERRREALAFLDAEKKSMSELEYGQEYLGLFLEELRQFFPDELIQKCCVLKRPEVKPENNNFAGCDIARLGDDETTIEILHIRNNNIIHQVENIIKKKQLTTQTEEDIIRYSLAYNCLRVGIDAGSGALGVGIFDRLLKNPLTKRRVVAMNNRAISLDRDDKSKQRIFKEDMYNNLASMMERGEIFLLDDPEVFMSLKSIQWELVNVAGNNKIRIFGNYSHVTEGLIRAAWLANKEKINKLRILYF